MPPISIVTHSPPLHTMPTFILSSFTFSLSSLSSALLNSPLSNTQFLSPHSPLLSMSNSQDSLPSLTSTHLSSFLPSPHWHTHVPSSHPPSPLTSTLHTLSSTHLHFSHHPYLHIQLPPSFTLSPHHLILTSLSHHTHLSSLTPLSIFTSPLHMYLLMTKGWRWKAKTLRDDDMLSLLVNTTWDHCHEKEPKACILNRPSTTNRNIALAWSVWLSKNSVLYNKGTWLCHWSEWLSWIKFYVCLRLYKMDY